MNDECGALLAMLRWRQDQAEAVLGGMSRVDLEFLADAAGELSELAEVAAARKRRIRTPTVGGDRQEEET